MPAIIPNPPSTATLIFGIILLFFFPIIGIILIVYYMIKKSEYNRLMIELSNQRLQQNNNERIERL